MYIYIYTSLIIFKQYILWIYFGLKEKYILFRYTDPPKGKP